MPRMLVPTELQEDVRASEKMGCGWAGKDPLFAGLFSSQKGSCARLGANTRETQRLMMRAEGSGVAGPYDGSDCHAMYIGCYRHSCTPHEVQ